MLNAILFRVKTQKSYGGDTKPERNIDGREVKSLVKYTNQNIGYKKAIVSSGSNHNYAEFTL